MIEECGVFFVLFFLLVYNDKLINVLCAPYLYGFFF